MNKYEHLKIIDFINRPETLINKGTKEILK